MTQKLISIIMPVYNSEAYVQYAIDSIQAQTYKNWELIAIDDVSKDKTNEILKANAKRDSRIRVITLKKNKGLAYTLNVGLDHAKGYYIARMDSDDISLPKRLESQIKFLQKNPGVVAVGCQVEVIDQLGNHITYKRFPNDAKKLYAMMFEMMSIQHPTLLTYARVMKKCRYENHVTAEDVSMFFKLLQYGNFGNVDKVLFKYRVRKDSNSLKDPKKTFHLTIKSRIQAVHKWGYKPTLRGILVNIAQFITVTVLPNQAVLFLYELMRFKTLVVGKFWHNEIKPRVALLRSYAGQS